MNDEISGHPQSSWTWADMFVTYRFWGLLLFYLFSLAASGMVLSWFPLLLRDVSPSSATTLSGWLFYVAGLSGLVGFYLAWAATRHRAKVVLLVAGLLQLVGGLLLALEPISASWLRYVGAVLFGLGTGTITLGVPAVLAGGMGGAQAFVVAFGLIYTVTRVSENLLTLVLGSLWDDHGSGALAPTAAILVFLGLLALLPVSADLFTRPPRARRRDWVVTPRNPLLVALGSLLTPIYYALVYTLHGDVASLRPSSRLLSPRGAVLTLFLVPVAFSAVAALILSLTLRGTGQTATLWLLVIGVLLVPALLSSVVTTTLVEPLNDLAAQRGRPPLLAPWVVFLFSILFPPVALALIQWAVNRSIAMNTEPV